MERSKKVIFISHCILNQNSVVSPLARTKEPYRDIIETIMQYNIGIHQLPCPEFRYLGLGRKPMTKSEYDTVSFRNLSKEISKDTINIMREYLANGYELVGLIGINQSPTCGIRDKKGIFMEELFLLLNDNNIKIPTIDVTVDYYDGTKGKEFIDRLENFLTNKVV